MKEESKIRVLYAEEFEHANPQDIVDLCFNLYRKHWNTWFFVDGTNRAFVNLMKVAFDESLSWDKDSVNPDLMRVLPVNFSTEHKNMLSHLHLMVNKEYLAIPQQFDIRKRVLLIRNPQVYDDMIDALRLSLKGFNIT